MRTSEFIVCRECKKVHVSGSHTERHWFDEFVYYDERVTDECSECCGVLEDGYTCDMCYSPTPESETAFKDNKAYCRDCMRECVFCFEVKPAEEFTPSGDYDNEWCADCAREAREAEREVA
jgi:hypothetical protein